MILASIGTSEPGNAVGVGRDAAVAAGYGARHLVAVAAVSAQSDDEMLALFALPSPIFLAQLERLREAGVFRIGALGSVENIAAAATFLRNQRTSPIVIDPVLRTSFGAALYVYPQPSRESVEALLRLPAILTPNVAEAEWMLQRSITGVGEMQRAARELSARGARAVLMKGGDVPGDPIDVLVDERGSHVFRASRLPQAMRGTGCTLAAALACELGAGRPLREAIAGARAYVRDRIAAEGQPRHLVQQAPFA